jgi:integrase
MFMTITEQIKSSSLSLTRVRLHQLTLAANVRSHRTMVGYKNDWRAFEEWCKSVGFCPLPATDETVALFLTWYLEDHRVTTAVRHSTAINFYHKRGGHPVPITASSMSRAVLNGARRLRKETPIQRTPLTASQLREISTALRARGDVRDLRDRAIMVLGMTTGLRGSGLANLELSDVTYAPQGLLIRERYSKTDQVGRGRTIGIYRGEQADTCPVRVLDEWLRVRGNEAGPLFCKVRPLHNTGRTPKGKFNCGRRKCHEWKVDLKVPTNRETINRQVRAAVAMIGLDPATYGSHSLRAGCATVAAENGASEAAIMRVTGHKTSAMVRKYIRPVTAFPAANPFGNAF